MGWPHDARTPTNPAAPQEIGACDRCYFRYPLAALQWQRDYRGDSLQSLGIRVCPRCLDDPQPQLRPIIIRGPEGAVRNPRPFSYAQNFLGGTAAPTAASPIYLDGSPLPGPVGTMMLDDESEAPLTDDNGNIIFAG